MALVLLVVVSSFLIAPALAPAAPHAAPASVPVRASATVVTPRAYYFDSSYFEVNWTESQDSCFYNYTFWWSTDLTTWTGYSLTNKVYTSVAINGFTAGSTIYWKVVDEDCSRANATSATWVFTMPEGGHLGYSWVNDSAVHLTWGLNYSYGGTGGLTFISHEVEFTNNVSVIWSTSDITNRNYTLVAPTPAAYAMRIVTVDTCNFCSPYTPNIGLSNTISFTTTAPVTASASATPTTGEAKVPVALTCSASSGVAPYTYAWAFGDGQTGSGPSVSHTYASAGSMDAVCTVTDAHNGTATSHVAITVNPAISVAPTASASSAAPGTAIIFNATVTGGTGGPYTITWNFGDGSSGTGAVATHTYSAPGTYIPTVTVTDALGGTTTKQLAAITVAAPSSGIGDLALFGGIGAVVIIAVVLVAFLMLRKRKGGPQNPPGAAPPPSP